MLRLPRRSFLTTSGLGLAAAFGPLGTLGQLGVVLADETPLTPDAVQFSPDIEPLVRLIESTPIESCVEMAIARMRQGATYRQILSAIFLAGIRNVNPQPPGFKFHCVFAVHAAHQLSLDAPVQDRLLPLFWALEEFKRSQNEDVKLGDFVLKKTAGPLPSPEKSWTEFHEAMATWNEPRADRAITALVRNCGAQEVIEGLWEYGARDYRNIGHKAIFVSNAWRTLQTIGWRHAEPVLRSLVLGLLDFNQKEVNGFTFESQSYLPNRELAKQTIAQLPADWTRRVANRSATLAYLDMLRTGDFSKATQSILADLKAGKASAQAVWDAVHIAGCELMMRQPGIYGIHTVTSAHALHYAYSESAIPQRRLVLMLQGVGWMCQFQQYMASRDTKLNSTQITALSPRDLPADQSNARNLVFETLDKDPAAAALLSYGLAMRGDPLTDFAAQARGLILRKPSDAHHYKYAASIFEDLDLVSPEWQPHMLATSVYYLRGSTLGDSALFEKVRAAIS